MAVDPTTESNRTEVDALRQRIDALEREQHERIARANAALAAAQDRSYWLDRWNVDLNALMSRPGAGELRAALRAARALYRVLYDARNRLKEHARDLPLRVHAARRAVEEERAHAEDRRPARFPRTLSPDLLRAAPVTERLHARLSDGDLESIERRLEPADAALWETADRVERKRLALAFAAHYGVQPALERSGLSGETPPAGVHTMAQGAPAAGGSTYYADLVVDSLRLAGLELQAGMAGLDFGCSSGRVVRVLAAAFPEVDWHACDPIPDAIEWARDHLPGIAFERSPEYPPLPYGDGQFDFAIAISIWSHFSEGAALDWLREMRRVVRAGGRLLLTTHGEQTISHTHREGVRSVEQLSAVQEALFEHGFWYAAEFGEAGDHGVANPDWGTAFLSPEWVLTKLTPEWHVVFFRPGRVEANQDLYVLERR
jgi:SAM-dependent methyltransferase